MATILAIDPGTTHSGWCLLEDSKPVKWGWDDNVDIVNALESWHHNDDETMSI